jgi:toxin ParE1/3/4
MIGLVLREAAERDIEGSFDHYMDAAGSEIATAFVLAVDAALAHIAEFPGTGSPRYGKLFDTPGLRFWLVSKFPYVLFYIERDYHVDVIRVLHQHSDIPTQLQFDVPDSTNQT